jgi:hypothetical protein
MALLLVVVLFTGFSPGSCDIVFVRDSTSPALTLVFVLESLQVPPSCARALAIPLRFWSLPFTRELVDVRPSTAAALPPVEMDEDVPASPVDVAPTPTVEADVPPLAALPPDPAVALPVGNGAWAIAVVLIRAAARKAPAKAFMVSS